jgi:hypothetical protein
MERIGFKEWSAVCGAILQGRQTIIIRKGGIAEGRDGFSFRHGEFYLFPTWFHEEAEKITESQFASPADASTDVTIKCAVAVEWSGVVTDWSVARNLAPFHILREEVVRERFEYKDAPGIHVAFVRAFQLSPMWKFPNEKRFGGCRSWVELPDRDDEPRLESVLSDAEFAQQREQLFATARLGSG